MYASVGQFGEGVDACLDVREFIPEDIVRVGCKRCRGEGGYEEYLRVISNPQSPDYEFMIKWSEITKADDETVEETNRRLKYFY